MKYTIKFLGDYLTYEDKDLATTDCFIVSFFKTIFNSIIAVLAAIFGMVLVSGMFYLATLIL